MKGKTPGGLINDGESESDFIIEKLAKPVKLHIQSLKCCKTKISNIKISTKTSDTQAKMLVTYFNPSKNLE